MTRGRREDGALGMSLAPTSRRIAGEVSASPSRCRAWERGVEDYLPVTLVVCDAMASQWPPRFWNTSVQL